MHRYNPSVDQLKFEQLPSTGRSSYRSNHSNITSTQTEHFAKIPHQQLLSHINPFNRFKYKQGQQTISRNPIQNKDTDTDTDKKKEKEKEKEKEKRQESNQQKINRITQKVLKSQSRKQNCSQCCRNGCVKEKMCEGKDKNGHRNLFNLRLQNLEGLRGQYGYEKIRENSITKIYKHNSQHDYHKLQDCNQNNSSTLQKKLSDLQTRLTQTQSKLHSLHLHTLQPHFNPKFQPYPYLQHIQQPSNSSLKLLKNIAQIKDIYTLIRDHKIIQSQINQKISKEINCIFDSLPKIKDDVQRSVKLMMDKWRQEDVRVRGCGLSGEGENKLKQQNEEKGWVKNCKEDFVIGQWAQKMHSDLEYKIHCQLNSMQQKIANLDKKLISQTLIKIIPTHSKPFQTKSIKIIPPNPSSPPITALKLTQELHPYSTRQPSQPQQPPQSSLQPPKTLHLQLPQQKDDNYPSCSLILSPLSSPSSSTPIPTPTPTPIYTYKHTYYIDNNRYLLDESMFYILDQNDKPIKVLDQQFDMLKNLCHGGSEKNIERGSDKENMVGNRNGNGNEVKGEKCGVLRFR